MRRFLTHFSIVAFCISNAYADNPEHQFAAQMLKTIAYAKQHSADIWPGFDLNSTALVTHFDNSNYIHTYAFNFSPVNPAWQSLTIDDQQIYYLDQDLYHIENIAWGFDKIDGQNSFIFKPDINISAMRNVADTVYFRFLNYQHFTDESNFPKTDPYSYPDYNGMTQLMQVKLSFLEIEALKNYLQEKDPAKKEISLKDAAAIHQNRTDLLDQDSRHYDTFFSRNWGLSGYVGWKSLNVSEDDQYLQALSHYCNIIGPGANVSVHNIENCVEYYRYNFTTLVYGLALDRKLNIGWKNEIQAGNATVEKLIHQYYPFTSEEAAARVTDIVKNHKYHSAETEQALSQKLRPYIEKVAELQERYQQQPGFELQIFTSPYPDPTAKKSKTPSRANARNLGKNANDECKDSYNINNKIVLFTNYSELSEYEGQSKLFSINLQNVPYVFINFWNVDFKDEWNKFKISGETKLIIDCEESTVKQFMDAKKHVTFTNLTLENNEAKIVVKNMNGDLDGSKETLILKSKI